jgi:hypothetical protein
MGLVSLALLMTGVWALVLAMAGFLVIFVAPLEITLFHGKASRMVVSVVQSTIAILLVVALVFGLSKMKYFYLQKKLRQ